MNALEDGRRVLVNTAMVKSLGMARGSAGGQSSDRLVNFISGNNIKPYVSDTLYSAITNPVKFKIQSGGIAYGYEATILADICEIVLKAREDGRC